MPRLSKWQCEWVLPTVGSRYGTTAKSHLLHRSEAACGVVAQQGYRMPDSYETADGKLDTAKRDAALAVRYQEVPTDAHYRALGTMRTALHNRLTLARQSLKPRTPNVRCVCSCHTSGGAGQDGAGAVGGAPGGHGDLPPGRQGPAQGGQGGGAGARRLRVRGPDRLRLGAGEGGTSSRISCFGKLWL